MVIIFTRGVQTSIRPRPTQNKKRATTDTTRENIDRLLTVDLWVILNSLDFYDLFFFPDKEGSERFRNFSSSFSQLRMSNQLSRNSKAFAFKKQISTALCQGHESPLTYLSRETFALLS